MTGNRLLIAAALLASVSTGAAADEIGLGRDIAKKHCARCHIVGDLNKYGGIDSTPSFGILKTLDDWRWRFETFYTRNPHPAFVRVKGLPPPTKLEPYASPVDITLQDVEHLVAFVVTLETP